MVFLLRHSFFVKKKKINPLYIYSFEKKCAKHSEVIHMPLSEVYEGEYNGPEQI